MTTSLPLAFLLGDMTPMELFKHGGPIMWPILLVSFLGITVVVERMLFIIRENGRREPEVVEKMLECVEKGDVAGALALGKKSSDSVARILVYSLNNKEYSLANAFIRASSQELTRGLLGTVTGMMKTFGSMQGDIGAAAGQITGGVAEALIATACGLFIAILGLLPFNYINARTEQAKQDISDASHALEIFIKKSESVSNR
ncbi:MAG: flagellar motor protein MotA [Verrucomicrobiales bacterium VVV1]|nr:MAG: flagellar motor protein MotA [Verrucomicrobiales bacterium VVV1]